MGLNIRKGDTVLVISGNSRPQAGRMVRGRVLAVHPKKGTALVEGVNMVKKHQKARGQQQPGGIVEKEAPINISNVALVCGTCGPVRIGHEVRGDRKVRVCKKCGTTLDK